MPKVSVTLPSLRPELLAQCVDSLRQNAGLNDYEIVVVSPFPVEGERIRWIEERERAGNCSAHATAYDHSTGDIVIAMSDYIIARRNWMRNVVEFIEEQESKHFPFCAGLFWANTNPGPAIGAAFGYYYPYFPAATRRSFEAAGGYFSRAFMAHFGDSDLALRFWAAGGKCQPCWDAVISQSHLRTQITVGQTGLKERVDEDMATFVAKWRDSLGANWKTNRMTAFNIGLPMAVLDFEDMAILPQILRQVGTPPRFPDARVALDASAVPPSLRYGQS